MQCNSVPFMNDKYIQVTVQRKLSMQYRVTQKVSDLGWVDLVLECSTILLGQ